MRKELFRIIIPLVIFFGGLLFSNLLAARNIEFYIKIDRSTIGNLVILDGNQYLRNSNKIEEIHAITLPYLNLPGSNVEIATITKTGHSVYRVTFNNITLENHDRIEIITYNLKKNTSDEGPVIVLGSIDKIKETDTIVLIPRIKELGKITITATGGSREYMLCQEVGGQGRKIEITRAINSTSRFAVMRSDFRRPKLLRLCFQSNGECIGSLKLDRPFIYSYPPNNRLRNNNLRVYSPISYSIQAF